MCHNSELLETLLNCLGSSRYSPLPVISNSHPKLGTSHLWDNVNDKQTNKQASIMKRSSSVVPCGT